MSKHRKPESDDVRVHFVAGCLQCGRTDRHTHPQVEHRALVDTADPYKQARRGGPR